MRWSTRLTQHFPCTVPLIGAPMADHSGAALAAAVCQAGGLGFIAAGHLQDNVEILETELQAFPVTQYPLCLGFIGHSVLADIAGWDRYEYILQKHRPAVVQFFAPCLVRHPVKPGVTNVTIAHDIGAKVFAQVGTLDEAVTAVQEGHVDGLMVQGGEAGGHGLRRGLAKGTLPLARSVVRRVRQWRPDLPVVAAGGVVDGAGLAAVLALGCDGAMLGTRLAATPESQGAFATTLADPAVTCDDVIRTTVLDAIQNEYSTTPWPAPYDSVGAVRNRTVREWEKGTTNNDSNDLRQALRDPVRGPAIVADYWRHKHLADFGMVHCGQGVGEIETVEPAAALIERISNEAADILRTLAQTLILPDNDDGDNDDGPPGT
jgi:nitronate monooxygenase